jgi:hypothetical protein
MQNLQLMGMASQTTNLLNDFHSAVALMPIVLRNRICEECGWSIHTYHEKCRMKFEVQRVFDRAEELIILTAYLQVLQEAFDQVEKHKDRLSASL